MDGILGLIMIALFFGFVAILLRYSLKSVQQQERWVIERFGKYNRILSPGLHWIIPSIEKVRAAVSIWEQPIELFEKDPWLDFREGGKAQLVDPSIWVRPKGAATNDELAICNSVRKMVYSIANWRIGTRDTTDDCIQRFLKSITVEEATGTLKDGKPWWEIVEKAFPDLGLKMDEWGLEVTRITIEDFKWSKEVEDARLRIYEAQREVVRMDSVVESAKKDAARQAQEIGGVISNIEKLLIKHNFSKKRAQELAPKVFAFVKAAETGSLFLTRAGGEEGLGPILADVAAIMEKAKEKVQKKTEG